MFYTTGYNQYNIGRFNGIYYESLHAEVDAVQKLKFNEKGKRKKINLFVYRINNNKEFRYARCCDNCIKQIYKITKQKNYKVNKIYYTDNNQNIITYN